MNAGGTFHLPAGLAGRTSPASELISLDRLLGTLVTRGTDTRAIERARLVAHDTGQKVHTVLLSLGLVSERQFADAAAELLGTCVVTPDRYPPSLPNSASLLTQRFLRESRALPLAETDGHLTVAVADPLDDFIPAAITAATGLPVRLEIAVPVELEAAMNRLLPDSEAQETGAEDGPALEDDAERLKDLAS
jgi:general secretion pathway protein E